MSNSKNLPFSFSMNINAQSEDGDVDLQTQQDACFSIAMMGDFSNSIDNSNISDRNFIAIDRFNFDEILQSLAPRLSLSMDDSGQASSSDENNINLSLESLKDFQPGSLYKNMPVFSHLRDLRKRLNNPATFKQAMLEMDLPEKAATDKVAPSEVPKDSKQPKSVAPSPIEPGVSLIDSIMDETTGQLEQNVDETLSTTNSKTKSLVDVFIRQTIGTRKTLSRDSRQDELVASVDAIIAQQMRNILHHPKFQALESLWRSVYFVVKRIRGGKAVKLYLFDINNDELAADLAADDVTQSKLYQQFCDGPANDINWNLIIGDYRFGADIEDMLRLSQIGLIAQKAGAHFIAAANESLIGCPSFATTPKVGDWQNEAYQSSKQAWTLLRQSSVAKSISLALPRFLLRMPYGNKTIPVTAFAFEEMPDHPNHNDYLWGNPAFLKAEQIARTFLTSGWDMNYANAMTAEDLPVHYFEQAGQTQVKPCAEIPLTDSGAGKMIAQGLIPLWSVRNADRIHSGDFHSISE
ncbi:MAG: type VI secretion system protein ImpC [Urechidicola sp.]|jgi:type VI secretion system protein ImpC